MTGPRLAALLLVALTASCTSTPTVRAVSDSAVDFTRYTSFGFETPLGTDRDGNQSQLSRSLVAAAQRQLEARGLHRDDASPQLLVNFNANVSDKLRVTTTSTPAPMVAGYGRGRGYYGYRSGLYSTWPSYQDQTTVTPYTEGTLNIDIADAARKQLVWECVVSNSVSDKAIANLDATVDAAVTAAFAKYPGAPKAK